MTHGAVRGAPPACTHPMAKAGYGKREIPGPLRRDQQQFAHLPEREAKLASFIDGLPNGAAIGHKALAGTLSWLGQAACRTALKELTRHGHLRRYLEAVEPRVVNGLRWVTRTFFSRTPHNAQWWEDFRVRNGLLPLHGEASMPGEVSSREPEGPKSEGNQCNAQLDRADRWEVPPPEPSASDRHDHQARHNERHHGRRDRTAQPNVRQRVRRGLAMTSRGIQPWERLKHRTDRQHLRTRREEHDRGPTCDGLERYRRAPTSWFRIEHWLPRST